MWVIKIGWDSFPSKKNKKKKMKIALARLGLLNGYCNLNKNKVQHIKFNCKNFLFFFFFEVDTPFRQLNTILLMYVSRTALFVWLTVSLIWPRISWHTDFMAVAKDAVFMEYLVDWKNQKKSYIEMPESRRQRIPMMASFDNMDRKKTMTRNVAKA